MPVLTRTLCTLLLVGLVSSLAASLSEAGIEDTSHNLSASGPSETYRTDSTQLCVFCHTPHNAAVSRALWNHKLTTGADASPDTATSPTSREPVDPFSLYSDGREQEAGEPESEWNVTALCLSCHDGVIATGIVYNMPPDLTVTGAVIVGSTLMDNDLSNDHPITPDFDCGGCHDPHDNSRTSFLLETIHNSQICVDCHNK